MIHEPAFKRPGARVRYNYTDGPVPAGTLGTVLGFLGRSQQAQIRWDDETVSAHTPDEFDVVPRGTRRAVVEAGREVSPMDANGFIELLTSLQPDDRRTSFHFQKSLAGERGGGSVYVNFVNLPIRHGQTGAESENNRASFWIEGFGYDPAAVVSKVKVEQSNNIFNRKIQFRAKTGSPEVVARYLAAYLERIVATVPPHFTHTRVGEARRGKRTFETYASEVERALIASGVRPGQADVWISNHGSFIDQQFKSGTSSTETAERILEHERGATIPFVDESRHHALRRHATTVRTQGTTYEEAKRVVAAAEAENKAAGDVLDTFPKLANGLTPDSIRLSPEYKTAKARYNAAFAHLRRVNEWFVKNFNKEIRAERASRGR